MEIKVTSYDTSTTWNGPDDSDLDTIFNAFIATLIGQTWRRSTIDNYIREYVDMLNDLEEFKKNN